MTVLKVTKLNKGRRVAWYLLAGANLVNANLLPASCSMLHAWALSCLFFPFPFSLFFPTLILLACLPLAAVYTLHTHLHTLSTSSPVSFDIRIPLLLLSHVSLIAFLAFGISSHRTGTAARQTRRRHILFYTHTYTNTEIKAPAPKK